MAPLPPEAVCVIRGNMTEVHCLLFHIISNNEILYAGTENGMVYVWNLKITTAEKIFKASDVACLSLHLFDDYLITQDKSCLLKVWKNTNNDFNCMYTKEFNNVSFCKIDSFKTDIIYLVIPQSESLVTVCHFEFFSINIKESIKHPDKNLKLGEVMHLKIFRSNIKLCVAVVYENGMLIIWDLLEISIIYSDKMTIDTPMAFDFDPVNFQGICGSNEKNIVIFKLDENFNLIKRKIIEITNAGTSVLRIRPDRKIVVAGCWDGHLRIFSWKTCKLLAVLNCHRASILDVRFSESTIKKWDSKHLLAAGGSDNRISFWRIYE